jgi:DNA-binding beta-propeller fold protein YncE
VLTGLLLALDLEPPHLSAAPAIRAALCAALVVSCASSPAGTSVDLPDGAAGSGFDDLRYSASLHRILAPAGRTGTLALVDPDTLAIGTVSGFSASGSYDGTHDFGATSVDEGHGLLFVTDRTSQTLDVVDPAAGTIVRSVGLGANPDYVRYVAATDEVWVTEPSASQIEVFSLSNDATPTPTSVATIPVANGPESLVIDQRSGRAYAHRWQSTTVVIDARTRAAIAEWPNGCAASRGLAVDEARGFFYAGCSEGTLSVLDAAGDGRVLSTMARGAGYDVIGYSPSLGHLYLAGTACKCLVVLGVSASGGLSFLGRFDATSSAHCAAADDRGHAWVCDPDGGRLLRIDDPYPASW